jgi:ABC-2 type transport system permease protein
VKKNIFESLKGRGVRFGGYTAILIVVVLAVVVVVNVLVQQVPGKLDLTKSRLYSLSPETKTLLDGLKTDVTIWTVGKPGTEEPTVKEILGRYAAQSRHVKLQTIDTDKHPGWTRQYDTSGQGIQPGTVVVEGGKKFRTIGPYDMVNYDTSNPNQQPQPSSLMVEQRVTSALLFVTEAKNASIGVLQGHGEQTLDTLGLNQPVSDENYAVKDVSLLSEKAVPADIDTLVVLAPKTDISADDAAKIRAWLEQGGRAVILMNVITPQAPMANLESVLESYGVHVENLVVVEGDPNRVAAQNPLYVIPEYASTHDILAPIQKNNYPMVMPGAQAVQTLELKRKKLKIEPLLTSSVKSYGIRDVSSAKTLARSPSSPSGPFTLALAITDPAPDASHKDTKLVVAGDIQFLGRGLLSQVPGNGEFFMNSLGWLREQKQTLTVRPKNIMQFRLSVSLLQAQLYTILVVILVPLLVLGTGLVVWVRRRHL